MRWIRAFNRKVFISSKVFMKYLKRNYLVFPLKSCSFTYHEIINNFLILNSASGCPIAAKNKGKSGYEGISSLSKYGPSSSTFGAFDQSTEHMMGIDDKDKNRMDTSDGMDEKVSTLFELSISMPRVLYKSY